METQENLDSCMSYLLIVQLQTTPNQQQFFSYDNANCECNKIGLKEFSLTLTWPEEKRLYYTLCHSLKPKFQKHTTTKN